MRYQWTDSTQTVALCINDDGVARASCLPGDPQFQAWLAAGNTPEPAAPQPAQRIEQIDARLAQIDAESIRPLRAIARGAAEPFDLDKLAALEAEADALRAERATL